MSLQGRRSTVRWAGKTAGVVAATYLMMFGGVLAAARRGWLDRLDVTSWVPGDMLLGSALLTAVAGMAWAQASSVPLATYQTFYTQLALWLGMLYVVFLGLTQLLRTPTNPMSFWMLVLLTCVVTNAWFVSGIGRAMMSRGRRHRVDRTLQFHIHAGTVVAGLLLGVTVSLISSSAWTHS